VALNLESKKVIVDQAREKNIEIRVVRNTLAKLAFKGTDFECVSEVLTGPSLFGFSMEDPGAAARLFKEFAKDNDKFEVKALSISGQLLDNGQIDVLAKLPTLEQALGQLACVTLAPITKLVRTFNEVPTKVTRVVGAVRDKKQEAA
jgi:large subunit ribosomal protein L10